MTSIASGFFQVMENRRLRSPYIGYRTEDTILWTPEIQNCCLDTLLAASADNAQRASDLLGDSNPEIQRRLIQILPYTHVRSSTVTKGFADAEDEKTTAGL